MTQVGHVRFGGHWSTFPWEQDVPPSRPMSAGCTSDNTRPCWLRCTAGTTPWLVEVRRTYVGFSVGLNEEVIWYRLELGK